MIKFGKSPIRLGCEFSELVNQRQAVRLTPLTYVRHDPRNCFKFAVGPFILLQLDLARQCSIVVSGVYRTVGSSSGNRRIIEPESMHCLPIKLRGTNMLIRSVACFALAAISTSAPVWARDVTPGTSKLYQSVAVTTVFAGDLLSRESVLVYADFLAADLASNGPLVSFDWNQDRELAGGGAGGLVSFDTPAPLAEIDQTAPEAGAPPSGSDVAPVQIYGSDPRDPWERVNRRLFKTGQVIDKYTLLPISRGYRAITTKSMRRSVANVLANINSPEILANDILQFKPKRAGQTIFRFAVNSSVGLGGLFDVAAKLGVERHDEDFGQTLAVWNVKPGPFLFIPLGGPTTVRDFIGVLVDLAFSPFRYSQFAGRNILTSTRFALTAISGREGAIEAIESIQSSAADPYTAFKAAYLQNREYEIRDGKQTYDDLPDFDDDLSTPSDGSTPGAEEAPISGASAESAGSSGGGNSPSDLSKPAPSIAASNGLAVQDHASLDLPSFSAGGLW